jgi:hypothetical protein
MKSIVDASTCTSEQHSAAGHTGALSPSHRHSTHSKDATACEQHNWLRLSAQQSCSHSSRCASHLLSALCHFLCMSLLLRVSLCASRFASRTPAQTAAVLFRNPSAARAPTKGSTRQCSTPPLDCYPCVLSDSHTTHPKGQPQRPSEFEMCWPQAKKAAKQRGEGRAAQQPAAEKKARKAEMEARKRKRKRRATADSVGRNSAAAAGTVCDWRLRTSSADQQRRQRDGVAWRGLCSSLALPFLSRTDARAPPPSSTRPPPLPLLCLLPPQKTSQRTTHTQLPAMAKVWRNLPTVYKEAVRESTDTQGHRET